MGVKSREKNGGKFETRGEWEKLRKLEKYQFSTYLARDPGK